MMTRCWLSLAATLLAAIPTELRAEAWPSWRGNVTGAGKTSETALPQEWGKDKNVRWRVALPERGNSTPIIHGDRIFITQAVEKKGFRGLMCFDRKNGELLWKTGVTYNKPETTHQANPYCSASPATDGERVVVSYGAAGLVCYDFAGKELWRREFEPIEHIWGNSSSPVIHGDLCIYYHGPGKGAFLIALNKHTGKTVWKHDEPDWETAGRTDGFKGRDDGVVGSFSTPIIIDANGRHELVMSFPTQLKAFDPTDGKLLWSCAGLNPLVYTSPLFHDGVVIAMGGFFGNSIAVRAGGKGDVTGSQRLWLKVRDHGGIGTGVVKDGYLYFHNSGGVAYCLNIKSGEEQWKARLPGKGKSWGSLLLSGDLIYTLSQPGDSVVFKADPAKFEAVAQSDLGEETNASIAVSDGELFIRTHEALWCISTKAED